MKVPLLLAEILWAICLGVAVGNNHLPLAIMFATFYLGVHLITIREAINDSKKE
jgi:hypothetical protein